MLDVHLYGKFRALTPNPSATADSRLEIDYREGETLKELMIRIGIDPEKIGDVFINHKVVEPGTIIPHDNSRIAIFPEGMVLLCGGQHLKGHGFITKKPPVKNFEYFSEWTPD